MKTKRISIVLLLIVIAVASITMLSACNIAMSINFIVDDEVYATIKTNGYETIRLPKNPEKEGDTFDGWYWDYGVWNEPFSVNSLLDSGLSSDMKVYAKWESDKPFEDEKNNNDGNNQVEIATPLSTINQTNCYMLTQTEEYYEPAAYQDKNFYYNIYHIGRVKNVPVVNQSSILGEIINYQGNKYEYEIKLSEITTNSIREIISSTFTDTTKVGVEVGTEISIGMLGLVEGKIGTSVSHEQSYSWSIERTKEVYNKTVREITTQRTQSFEGAETGYYRYTLFINLDEFVVLRKSKATGEIETLPYSKLVGEPCYSWEYRSDAAIFDYDIPKFDYSIDNFPNFNENGTELTVPDNIGTKEIPMYVYTAQELIDSLKKNYESIKIGQHIDMSNTETDCVEYFNGTLDGNGKTISNLKIDVLSSGKYAGLIGKLEGNVTNIVFKNPEIVVTSSGNNILAGVIAGEISLGGSITNCKISGCKIDARAKEHEVNVGARYCVVGGIVGKISGGASIEGCTVSGGDIYGYSLRHDAYFMGGMDEAAFVYIGGIIGELASGSIKNCTANADLKLSAKAEARISVPGFAPFASHDVYARICMGGIIGRQSRGTIEANNRTTNVILDTPTFNAWNDHNGGIGHKYFETYMPKPNENQNVGRLGG